MTTKYIKLQDAVNVMDAIGVKQVWIEHTKELPTLEIDTLQRYNTAKPTDFIDTTPIIYESDNGEYVKYSDIVELLNRQSCNLTLNQYNANI